MLDGLDREFAVDAITTLFVSALIAFCANELVFMTVLVPVAIVGRTVAWALVRPSTKSLASELVFFALCTGLGAFNDWNSVVNHEIYSYSVPHFFPSLSSIPIWMLLFWGMILRLLASLVAWERLGARGAVSDKVRLGRYESRGAVTKLALLALLVLLTRQAIYRLYLDPIWSWVPFAAALVAYVLLFELDRHELKLGLVILVGGPLFEVLYIHVGGLHHYLGWLGGVPIWIALWWVVALLVWKDIATRVQQWLFARF